MKLDIIKDYEAFIQASYMHINMYETFQVLIEKYISGGLIESTDYSAIGSLWQVLTEHVKGLNASTGESSKDKTVTPLKKIDAWNVNEQTNEMNKPVILRVVRMGPYHSAHAEVYLSAVDKQGNNIVNLINFTYGDTPHLFPLAKERLEKLGYDTGFAKWNRYGSLEFKQYGA